MAREDKLSPGIQVFRGSRPRQDVFAANAGAGCCGSSAVVDYDKLADRTRFDNALAHTNPLGGVDRFEFPFGDGFQDTRSNIIKGINENGVGFHISVLAVPTYAFVTGVSVHIEADEPGLSFDLVTRNGLALPTKVVKEVTSEVEDCTVTRSAEDGDASNFEGFGDLGSANAIDIFGRDGDGEFSLEADEIALKVASMPANGKVSGQFAIRVSVAYEVISRAEY